MDEELNAADLPIASASAGDSQKDAIAAAIKDRNLIEGMTYDEACRAARSRGVVFSSRNGETVYHWNIMGQVGVHQEVLEQHVSLNTGASRSQTLNVADYGVIGYVEAAFIEGKLVSFRQVHTRFPYRE